MNIFILSNNAESYKDHLQEQVVFMCDRHIVKMIAESTQMLVTALNTPTAELPVIYPEILTAMKADAPCAPLATNQAKHPCTRWVMADPRHFNYLAMLAYAMCQEHQYRYPLSPTHAYYFWLRDLRSTLSIVGYGEDDVLFPTRFAVAIKDKQQQSTNTPLNEAVDIYRKYYVRDKHRFATWKRRAKPVWFILLEDLLAAKGQL